MPSFSIINSTRLSNESQAIAFAKLRELLPELVNRKDEELRLTLDAAFDEAVTKSPIRSFFLEGTYRDNGQRYGSDTWDVYPGETVILGGINYHLDMQADGDTLESCEVHSHLFDEIIPLDQFDVEETLQFARPTLQAQSKVGDETAIALLDVFYPKMQKLKAKNQSFAKIDNLDRHCAKRDESTVTHFLDTELSSYSYAQWLRKIATQQHLAQYPKDDACASKSTSALFHLAFLIETWATELEKFLD